MNTENALPPVLFEDEAILAFDKPSGLLIAPDRWDKKRVNLMTLVHEQLSPDTFNVHRLDRETSGVLLCAKTKPALDTLSRAFENREVEKRYLALTRGAPREDEGIIRRSLAPDLRRPGFMRVTRHGKPAETEFVVRKRWRGFAQVDLTPRTGRQHQLRVHLAALGCPILADARYGDGRGLLLSEIKRGYHSKDGPERPLMGRLALHAESLTFSHPLTGQPMTIRAPCPREFEVAIRYLDRFAGVIS